MTIPVLVLRGLDDDDVTPDFVAALNDPEVTAHMATGRVPQTRGSALDFLRAVRAGGGLAWAVIVDVHMGNALLRIDWSRGVGDVGILIWRKDFWGVATGLRGWPA